MKLKKLGQNSQNPCKKNQINRLSIDYHLYRQ